MKKNDLLVMLVVYIITSTIIYSRVGISFQFFMYIIIFPIVYVIFVNITKFIRKK